MRVSGPALIFRNERRKKRMRLFLGSLQREKKALGGKEIGCIVHLRCWHAWGRERREREKEREEREIRRGNEGKERISFRVEIGSEHIFISDVGDSFLLLRAHMKMKAYEKREGPKVSQFGTIFPIEKKRTTSELASLWNSIITWRKKKRLWGNRARK